MAVGDIVSPHLATTSPTTFQAEPPHYGIVIAEDGGPPITKQIIWDRAVLTQPEAAALTEFNLDVISDAEEETVETFLGRMVLRIAPGGAIPASAGVAGDPAGGTSREFSGRCVAVYTRTPVGGVDEEEYLVMQVENGGPWMEDRVSQFAVLRTR